MSKRENIVKSWYVGYTLVLSFSIFPEFGSRAISVSE